MNNNLIKKLELERFEKDIENFESRYLNLIYHPLFNKVCTREEYDKTREMMEWSCAICNSRILLSKRKYDVENFVCETCKKEHNNKNVIIDRRILDSRTKLYKHLENNLYQQLEDSLNRINGEV